MTEPTTADREAALANYWHSNNPAANADMARQVARFLAAARAEERERCLRHVEARMKLDWTAVDEIAAKIRSGEP
jgi:hypothetical protein